MRSSQTIIRGAQVDLAKTQYDALITWSRHVDEEILLLLLYLQLRAGVRRGSRIAEKDEWINTRVLATNRRANDHDSGIGVEHGSSVPNQWVV